MSMKKTDLEKNKAFKLRDGVRYAGTPDRFAAGSAPALSRREQRKLDHAAGLVPFACKLHSDLVDQLNGLAQGQALSVHELVERLIKAGLASEGVALVSSKPAPAKAEPKKPAIQLPVVKAPAKAEKKSDKKAAQKAEKKVEKKAEVKAEKKIEQKTEKKATKAAPKSAAPVKADKAVKVDQKPAAQKAVAKKAVAATKPAAKKAASKAAPKAAPKAAAKPAVKTAATPTPAARKAARSKT